MNKTSQTMRQAGLWFLACTLFTTFAFTSTAAVTPVEPGDTLIDGANYYKITSAAEMLWFERHVNSSTANAGANAILMNDIDLSPVCSATAGSWVPIANKTAGYSTYENYSGTFDGNGHTLSNLYIESTERESYASLFHVQGGTIKNLTVNANITGKSYCAAIVCTNYGIITGCTATGSITGTAYCGGIVYDNLFIIEECTNRAAVTGTSNEKIGGIAGDNENIISNCKNEGAITNNSSNSQYIGGIVGFNHGIDARLSRCYNTATIIGKSYVGGIVGYNNYGPIESCYSTGNITAYALAGGIVGHNDDGQIASCHSTGNIAAGSLAGAIAGSNTTSSAAISNCYYPATVQITNNGKVAANGKKGVGNGTEDAACHSMDAFYFANGKVARLLNGGDGTTEMFLGMWGQTIGSDNHPVFMTGEGSNAVYMATVHPGSSSTFTRYTNADGANLNLADNAIALLDGFHFVTPFGTNIVDLNGMAETVVLTDKKGFYLPNEITAATLTYKRSNTVGYNSVCLPFALSKSDLSDDADIVSECAIEQLYSKASDQIVFYNKATEVAASTPCLVYCPAELTEWNITKSDVTLTPTAGSVTRGNTTLTGSFTSQTIGDGKYKLNTTGDAFGITKTATATVTPFRLYLETTGSGIAAFDVRHGTFTGIVNPQTDGNGEVKIFDLTGGRVTAPVKGSIYIINGKKQIWK